MVRLTKDAPWNEVTLSNGKINKRDWASDELDIRPIRQFVEYKENIVVHDDLLNITSDTKVLKESVDYSNYSKSDLVAIAKSKSIDIKGLNKAQIIEKLCI